MSNCSNDAVCRCRILHGGYEPRRQRLYDAVPIQRLEFLVWRAKLHGGCGVKWADKLYRGHGASVSVGGDFGFHECQLLHGDDHSGCQWQYDAMPIHRMGFLDQYKFLYAGYAIDRTSLHSGCWSSVSNYRYRLGGRQFLHTFGVRWPDDYMSDSDDRADAGRFVYGTISGKRKLLDANHMLHGDD